MGRGTKWTPSETAQLCRSWLETSDNALRSVSEERMAFTSRMYAHWLEHTTAEARSEMAIIARWKKLQPQVTSFCEIYNKLKSREGSRWNEYKLVDAALNIYAERNRGKFEFLAAWELLRDKPKWKARLQTSVDEVKKRRVDDDDGINRLSKYTPAIPADLLARYAAACERKATLCEEDLHYRIFMQAPDSVESKVYFDLRRKALTKQRKALIKQLGLSSSAGQATTFATKGGTPAD